MRYLSIIIIVCLAGINGASAQEKWGLRKCVDYAMSNNISIKQIDLQQKISAIQLKQSQMSRYPNVSLGNSYSKSFGLRENPTTGIFEDQSFFNVGLNMQTSASIFNWFSRRNTIAANEYDLLAAKATVDKQKDDISLMVANAFLQALLAREQEKIAGVQLTQSKAQLENTRKLVNAGSLPELNAAELEAQVARDSSTLISALGNVTQSLLSLKSIMNLDAAAPFEIEAPPVELIPVDPIADLQPDYVYALALKNLPQQRVNDLKYKAGEKNVQSAWGSMKPTISAFGGLSTNYVYFKAPIYQQIPNGTSTTPLTVTTNTGTYSVVSPVFTQGGKTGYITPNSFGSQLKSNFGQNVGISINVPLFNGGALRSNYERSKINLQNLNLQKEADNQKLKQDIYQAYNSAMVALAKFNASKVTVETSQRTYDFASKRAAVGMLGTFELITNQNNLFRAKLEYISNQFDYVFKMKVLEFYKGQGIKL
jgi:outer membrane protein